MSKGSDININYLLFLIPLTLMLLKWLTEGEIQYVGCGFHTVSTPVNRVVFFRPTTKLFTYDWVTVEVIKLYASSSYNGHCTV